MGKAMTGRTSIFFSSDLSPRSFSCPSTRFLCCRKPTSVGRAKWHSHLAPDEVQTSVNVLFRL